MSEEKKLDQNHESLSRRDFLFKASVLTTGLTVAGSGLVSTLIPSIAEGAAPTVPWPWAKLDLDNVRALGVAGYTEGG